jgi:excisionase family DNA binding protein
VPRRPRPIGPRPFYTTGDLARLFGVNLRTATRMVDSGVFPGFRIPGGQNRRIPHASLVAYVAAHPEVRPAVAAVLGPGWDGGSKDAGDAGSKSSKSNDGNDSTSNTEDHDWKRD